MPYLEQATGRFGLSRSEVRSLTDAALPDSDIELAHLGFPRYAATASPVITAEQRAAEIAPATVAGVLTQQWSVVALTAAELAARPEPLLVNIAAANVSIANGLVTTRVKRKITEVNRSAAGRFRGTLADIQPDADYIVLAAAVRPATDASRYFCEPVARTTSTFDVVVTALSSVAGVLSMADADPPNLFLTVWRVQK